MKTSKRSPQEAARNLLRAVFPGEDTEDVANPATAGISEAAYERMQEDMAWLSGLSAEELHPAHGNREAHRKIRYLAAAHDLDGKVDDDELPAAVCWLIGNPELTPDWARAILDCDHMEVTKSATAPTATLLREAVHQLQSGLSQRQVAHNLQVSRGGMIRPLATYLGVEESRHDYLRMRAKEHVLDGRAVAEFMDSEDIGRTSAYKYLKQAREELGVA